MPTTTAPAPTRKSTGTPRIERVRALAYPTLWVRFANGEERVFDVSDFIQPRTAFTPLCDEREFRRVEVINGGGGVGWACGADLSRDTLYLRGARALPPNG